MLNLTRYNIIEFLRFLCILLLPLGIIINETGFTNVVLCISIFICLCNLKEQRNKWIDFDKKFLFIILLFCAGIIISNIFSIIDMENSIKWAKKYCYWLLPGIVIYCLWNEKKYCKYFFSLGVFLGCFILCAYAGYEHIILNIDRPKSLTASPNSWPAFLVMSLPFLLYFLPNKLLKIFITFFITYGILLSQSRTSFVALLLLLFVYFALNLQQIKDKFFNREFVYVAISILVICAGSFSFNAVSKNITNISTRMLMMENYDLEKQGGDRIYLWKSSIEIINDYYLHGVGLRNFNKVYVSGNYMNPKAKEPNLESPHNIFLHYLVEMGIIGTLPIIILLFSICIFLKNNINKNVARAMLLSLIAVLCNNMLDYQLIGKYYYELFWVLIFATFAECFDK